MLKDQQELIDMLTARAQQGGPDYRRRARTVRTVETDAIAARLDDEGQELFERWQEEITQDTDLFGADQFRLGYELGASGLIERLVGAGLLDRP